MEFRLFCRKPGEDWIMDADDNFDYTSKALIVENRTEGLGLGGCFDTGVGALDIGDTGLLNVPTEGFTQEDQEYEFRLEVRKDIRMSYTHLMVKIERGVPPIMNIK